VRPMAAMGPPAGKSWADPDLLDVNSSTRMHRTVRVALPPGGRDYNRGSFAPQVTATCGLQNLEACGPMAAGHVWMLTFNSIDAKERFVNAGDFITREGAQARVTAVKKQRHTLRLHWIPFHVPMKAVVKAFERYPEITVTGASYDKSVLEGLTHVNSLIRTLWIETESPHLVPHAINWHFEGQSGQSLVTMRNRAPVCLKCFEAGHMRKDCPSNVKCRICARPGHDDPKCELQKSWASVGAMKPIEVSDAIAAGPAAMHSSHMEESTPLLEELINEVTGAQPSTPHAPQAADVGLPDATLPDVTYAIAATFPGAPQRPAVESVTVATATSLSSRPAEWPTPSEAYSSGEASATANMPEPVVIPDTPVEAPSESHSSHAGLDDPVRFSEKASASTGVTSDMPTAAIENITIADSQHISQFSSIDISQDLALSDDYETSEDNDQTTKVNKNRTLSESSSSEPEITRFTKEDFLKTTERHRSRSVAKPKRRRKHRKH
jgi:hypothetical protein